MDILELYRQILQSLGCPISPEGLVSTTINGNAEPLIITKADNKRLTLPTPFYLDNPQEEIMVQFHPMSEGIDKGESEVLTAFKRLVTTNIMYRICDVMALVAKVAADPELQNNLKPAVTREFSKYLNEFDKKTQKVVMEILGKINPSDRDHNGKSCTAINITLARRINILDKPFQRVAVVSFPLLEALITAKEEMQAKGNGKIFGVTPGRKAQYDLLINLFNFIFPEGEVVGTWSAGSNSLAAPYFHSLLLTYIKIAERLNTVVGMLSKNANKDYPELLYNLSWKDAVQDLSGFVGHLPSAQHNKGKMAGKSEEDSDMKSVLTRMAPEVAHAPVQQQQVVQQHQQAAPILVQDQPVYQQQPVLIQQEEVSSADPFAALNRINKPVQQQQYGVAMQQAVVNGQLVNIPVQHNQPVMVQHQPVVMQQQLQPQVIMQQPIVQQQLIQQEPIVQAIRVGVDQYGRQAQETIQITLSQFNQMVATGQLPQQQPVQVGNQAVPANPAAYVYQDGSQPSQFVPGAIQNNQGYVRQGGRMSTAEREHYGRQQQQIYRY